MMDCHSTLRPGVIPRRGKVDFTNLFNHFSCKLIKEGKDLLDVFVKEGLAIRNNKPSLNNMVTNGFVGL